MTLGVRFNGTDTSKASTTTNLPASSNITVCGFFKLSADRDYWTCLFGMSTTGGNGPHMWTTESDGVALKLWQDDATIVLDGPVMTVGSSYFLALVMNGTTCKMYWKTAGSSSALSVDTGTLNGSYTPGGIYVGGANFTGEAVNGVYWGWRVFAGVELTASELESECTSLSPVRQTNIHAAWLFDSGSSNGTATDISGAGRNLTYGSGTIATETVANMQRRDGVRNLGMFWG